MCVRVLQSVNKTLVAHSTTERFDPWTDWMPSTGIDEVSFQVIVRNATSNFRVRPGLQFASSRINDPDSVTAVGTQISSDGAYLKSVSPSGASKYFIRFGALYALSTGTEEAGEVTIVPMVHRCGNEVGSKVLEINPGLGDTSTTAYFEVSSWFPVVALDKVKASYILERNASASTLKYATAMRVAIDPDDPGEWDTLESFVTASAGNDDRNSGELSPLAATTSNVYGQLGIGVQKTSASDDLRAIIKVAAAATYA